MLVILMFCFVLASSYLLSMKKTKEALFLFGICFSLMLHISGIMILISKKGGIPDEVVKFLFFSKTIQKKVRYFYLTLNQLGFLIAVGRVLYPFFLLKFSVCYSMIARIKKNTYLKRFLVLIPLLNLILYYPQVYRNLTERNPFAAKLILHAGNVWINFYLIAAILLFLYEYVSIQKRFLRKQLRSILVSILALTGIYILYYNQDPGQVYRFYDYTFSWGKSIGYLKMNPTLSSYLVISIISIICCILGFYSLLNFTAGNYLMDKENLVLESKFDMARVGASMFVHGMKNQLLAGKIIHKRIHQIVGKETIDVEKLLQQLTTLEEIHELMYERIETLYQSTKQKSIQMKPEKIDTVITLALDRFHRKYPAVSVRKKLRAETTILVDKEQFCEVLSNILLNGYEAILFAERGEADLSISCHNDRFYTIIEIRDNGIGINEKKIKKIFYPFYSSKNSKSNWGMGLYYVKEVVKSHHGMIRVESKIGEGTSFNLLLPRYGE